MLFIEDIKYLSENFNLKPRLYTEKEPTGHCVYGYIQEEDDCYGPKNSLRYIGEGKQTRPISVHENVRVPKECYIVIFIDNLSKREVKNIETHLIKHYGGICNGSGILENIKPFVNYKRTKTLIDQIPQPVIKQINYKSKIPDSTDWDYIEY